MLLKYRHYLDYCWNHLRVVYSNPVDLNMIIIPWDRQHYRGVTAMKRRPMGLMSVRCFQNFTGLLTFKSLPPSPSITAAGSKFRSAFKSTSVKFAKPLF